MQVPSYKNIRYTDYDKKYQDLVSQLAQIINGSFNVAYQALNKRVNLQDNMQGGIVNLTVKVNSNGVPLQTTSFAIDSSIVTLDGFQVLQAINLDNPGVYPTSCPFISYTQQQKGVTVNNIAGLPANYRFQLRIMAYGH